MSMKRRNFLGVLGGAVAWPFAAQAQRPERVRRIAVLLPFSENDPEVQARFAALKQRLKDLGWTDGRSVHLDHRFTDENTERIRIGARELVAVAPDVIVVYANSATDALPQATRVIPIVFAQVSAPVTRGFVASLARPDGNITGFQNF
jgi:putative ABC transport system substrate-binding protein